MRIFHALNQLRWTARWGVKCLVVAVVGTGVCFPNLPRLVRHLVHWRDPDALIDPYAAALRPWVESFQSQLGDIRSPDEALARVEPFVVERLPYAWDWETWGNADYLPTVSEILAAGREDCDGRAVIAASLLRASGFKVRLATDFAHVWVDTDHGATMSPGSQQAVVVGEEGVTVNPSGLSQLPRAMAFGISVFYWHREMLLVLVTWAMMIRPGRSWWRNILGLLLLSAGLFMIRHGGRSWPVSTDGAGLRGPAGLSAESAWILAGLIAWCVAWIVCSSLGQRKRAGTIIPNDVSSSRAPIKHTCAPRTMHE